MPIKPRNPNNVRSTELGAAHEDHEHAHSDLTGVSSDQHHAEAHSVASHDDTTATGAELETLTDGSDADSLHTHGAIQTDEEVEDIVGGMLTGNTETLITVTYEDGDGTIDFVVDNDLSNYDNVPGWIADITGSPLSELQDVTITSIGSDEILVWNGSAWINQTLAEAGISATGHSHTESDITDLSHTTDHGALGGKGDDDHTQYLNDTRHGNAHAFIRAERITSNQTISSSTFTTVIYNSVVDEGDADDHLDINTSTGVATINTAGVYFFSGGALSNADSWNRIIIRAILNGSTAIAQMDYYPRTGGNAFILNSLYNFSATDALEIQVRYETHDGADFALLDNPLTYFSLVRWA